MKISKKLHAYRKARILYEHLNGSHIEDTAFFLDISVRTVQRYLREIRWESKIKHAAAEFAKTVEEDPTKYDYIDPFWLSTAVDLENASKTITGDPSTYRLACQRIIEEKLNEI